MKAAVARSGRWFFLAAGLVVLPGCYISAGGQSDIGDNVTVRSGVTLDAATGRIQPNLAGGFVLGL